MKFNYDKIENIDQLSSSDQQQIFIGACILANGFLSSADSSSLAKAYNRMESLNSNYHYFISMAAKMYKDSGLTKEEFETSQKSENIVDSEGDLKGDPINPNPGGNQPVIPANESDLDSQIPM